MWGLPSAMVSALRKSCHPPEMEINPPKTVYGCPFNGHNPLTLDAFVSVQSYIYTGWPPECSAVGNATATKRAWATRKDGIELVKGGIDWLVLSAQQRQKVKAWWRESVRQIGDRSGLYVKQGAFSCHFGFERLLSDVSTAISAWAVSNTLTPARTPRLMMRCIVMPSTVLPCVCF